MIDDKKIEDAARAYSKNNACSVIDRNGYMSLGPELENAFETGAHWALKQFKEDLWHPAEEEPMSNASPILFDGRDREGWQIVKLVYLEILLGYNIVIIMVLFVGHILRIYFQRKEVSNEYISIFWSSYNFRYNNNLYI